MRIVVNPGVRENITVDGFLVLASPGAVQSTYPPEAAAVWISLRQAEGDITVAAGILALDLGFDTSDVSFIVRKWVAGWKNAGLVTDGA
ncbi:hypothetical protein [Streptomyces sp. NPDC059215]|uniref:hypothetical protein n=1 Tax=Streptomyces sp. NPDC059215 TaxID=3346772 RepID=UPI0036891BFB